MLRSPNRRTLLRLAALAAATPLLPTALAATVAPPAAPAAKPLRLLVLGGTRFVYGTVSSGESVVIEARERLGLKAGGSISFGIRPERAMLFSTSGTRLRNI